MLPRNNPFDDYDEKKFKTLFRLSKVAVSKLLEQVIAFSLFSHPSSAPFRCVIAITIATVNIEVLNSIRDVFVRYP